MPTADINWSAIKLPSDATAIRWPRKSELTAPIGRGEQVAAWFSNVDDDGNVAPLITPELAERLLLA